MMGSKAMSVPDSCCHTESPGCGRNLFQTTDLKNIVERIHAHGCLTIMQVRLKTHVSVNTSDFKYDPVPYNLLPDRTWV